ncbi:MAG TPA: phosphate/phosphite/phosphonate ABC transporter substrate-binding protein [Candidatus Rifleibacterium sp.]|nr:phosphate/phosphite/phosphonate ABC transporter substrate-binding protein [Candidatus Rifleibacterium sp.]
MRLPLIVTLTMLSLLIAGWFAIKGPAPVRLQPVIDQSAPVFLGVIPFIQPDKLREQIEPVCRYLQKKLGRKVVMLTASDYESLARLLELNKIHIAWFSHASFERLRRQSRWEAICRPMQYGSVLYDGQIVVRSDSPASSIQDLKGKVFAYVDRYSGSGFYFPNLYMVAQGIDPLAFFARVEFTQSHRSSILGVIDGTYDAAAVFSASLVDKNADGLKVIARTGPIPNDPIVVREDLDAGLKSRIANALLQMHTDPDGAEELKTIKALRGTDKFVAEAEIQAELKRRSK